MENVAVISHIGDIDGVGSAALIKMRFGMPASNIFFAAHAAKEMKEVEAGIRKLYAKKILLFVTDLTPEHETAPYFKRIIKGVRSKGGKVVFLDHHPWREYIVEEIAKKSDFAAFGENKHMCATDLVHSFLGLDGAFVREFTDLVHHIDLFIKMDSRRQERLADTYKLGIDHFSMSKSYGAQVKKLRHLASAISSRKFLDKETIRAAVEFERINHARISEMGNDLYVISGKIAIGFSKQVDSSDACRHIMKRALTDIGMIVNIDHSKASMRSVKSNTTPLANELGGGGHPHASGFNIDSSKYNFFRTKKDRQAFADDVEKLAEKVGLV
jgi:uncharacterized protein